MAEKTIPAAIYARVSTADQDPGMQLRECTKARGWQVVDEYVDRGVSGVKESRSQVNRLMADARKRERLRRLTLPVGN